MGAGKVVIGTANENVYGAGVLRNGRNVILIEPDNPTKLAQTLIDLIENEPKRKQIGERARQTIQDFFSWDRVCAQTIQVYQEAVRKQR
jgi:glycosyltransferase involved in cell wall biosynthesis